jgi:hypothetical protein
MIGLFICYLLDPTSSWAFCLPDVWSSVGSWFGEIEVSSLAPKHIINPGELKFPIGLPTDWQSPIGPLCLNQAEWLHHRHNSGFIFLFDILFHWCYGVVDVLKIKKITIWLQFLSCTHSYLVSGLPSIFQKDHSHLVLIGHARSWLDASSTSLKLQSCSDVTQSQSGMCFWF